MALSLESIVVFLGLFGPLFTVMQGLAYLAYVLIAIAIVGGNLCTFFAAALKII